MSESPSYRYRSGESPDYSSSYSSHDSGESPSYSYNSGESPDFSSAAKKEKIKAISQNKDKYLQAKLANLKMQQGMLRRGGRL